MTLVYFKEVKVRKRPIIMRYLQLTAFKVKFQEFQSHKRYHIKRKFYSLLKTKDKKTRFNRSIVRKRLLLAEYFITGIKKEQLFGFSHCFVNCVLSLLAPRG